MIELGQWVRSGRVAMSWTQAEFARRVGTDVGSVSRWERGVGRPGLQAFRRMCVIFERSADDALGLPEPIRKRTRRAAPDGSVTA